MLRDKLVWGVRDASIQKKLLGNLQPNSQESDSTGSEYGNGRKKSPRNEYLVVAGSQDV